METLQEQAINDVLRPMRPSRGVVYVEAITQIVTRNLQNGRVDLGEPEIGRSEKVRKIQQYTERVVNFYDQEGERVHALQVRHDSVLWEQMFKQLYQWALYAINKKWSMVPIGRRQQLAEEITSEACVRALNSYYFFDTPLDAWLRIIVWNVTYEIMRRYFRDIQRTEQMEDSEAYDLALAVDVKGPENDLDIDAVLHLQKAIQQLPQKQRQVIVSHYVDGLSMAEIAEQSGASPNNVYQLHYQGLKNLRKHLV